MTDKQKKLIAAGGIALFLAASAGIFLCVGGPLIQYVSEPEQFRAWVDERGIVGRLAFVGMMALQILIAVIPGEPLEIAAGYAFGILEGTLLCMAGAFIGSALVVLFVRKCGVKAIEVFFPREKIDSLKFLQNTRRLNLWVFLVFFIPGTPKDILSYCIGLTRMKMSAWLAISTVARVPSIITSTIGGDALGMGDNAFAALVFAATLLVSLAGIIIYRKLCRTEARRAE